MGLLLILFPLPSNISYCQKRVYSLPLAVLMADFLFNSSNGFPWLLFIFFSFEQKQWTEHKLILNYQVY